MCGVQSLCSWSLVELYRALESSVEAHKAVLAAHPMYANLMERALAKVVLQHVTTLEKFCQVDTAHLLDTLLFRYVTTLEKFCQVCTATDWTPFLLRHGKSTGGCVLPLGSTSVVLSASFFRAAHLKCVPLVSLGVVSSERASNCCASWHRNVLTMRSYM